MELDGKRIAILTANDGVEQVELTRPCEALRRAAAATTHIAPRAEAVQCFSATDRGDVVEADAAVAECDPGEFEAMLSPKLAKQTASASPSDTGYERGPGTASPGSPGVRAGSVVRRAWGSSWPSGRTRSAAPGSSL